MIDNVCDRIMPLVLARVCAAREELSSERSCAREVGQTVYFLQEHRTTDGIISSETVVV